MMTILRLSILSLLLVGCGAAVFLIPKEEISLIPKGSTKVIAATRQSQNDLLSHFAKYFAREGFPVQTDRLAMQVSTGFKSIEGGATVRMMAFIDSTDNESRITISGEWGLNSDGQAAVGAFSGVNMSGATNKVIADWNMMGTKPGIAFQHMVVAARSLQGATITYAP